MSLTGLLPTLAPILSRDTAMADLGFYFVAISPTPGTGIVETASITTFALAEAAPMLVVYNGSSATSNPVNIYPLYLRITMTQANAGGLTQRFTLTLDQGNRVTTQAAATGVLTINNVNMGSGNKSQAQISAGASLVTSAASTQRRIIANQSFRNGGVVAVIGDVYQFNFGSTEQIDPMSLVETGTAICNVTYGFAPVVVGPNQSLLFQHWAASATTGAGFEYEFGYIEK
jgi:hypothetical protein